jgi:hypothetical protein
MTFISLIVSLQEDSPAATSCLTRSPHSESPSIDTEIATIRSPIERSTCAIFNHVLLSPPTILLYTSTLVLPKP